MVEGGGFPCTNGKGKKGRLTKSLLLFESNVIGKGGKASFPHKKKRPNNRDEESKLTRPRTRGKEEGGKP